MAPAGWTEPIVLSDVAHAWLFPNDGALYTESLLAVPRVEHVKALFDFFEWVGAYVPTDRPATLVHDWRSFKTIPTEVRRAFAAHRRAMTAARVRRVVVATSASPVVRMGVQAVSLTVQMLGLGVPLELVADPSSAIEKWIRQSPDPSLHARLRLAWRHADR